MTSIRQPSLMHAGWAVVSSHEAHEAPSHEAGNMRTAISLCRCHFITHPAEVSDSITREGGHWTPS